MVVWWFFGVWTRTRTRVVPRSPFCILERQIFITNVQKRGLKFDLFSVLYKTGLQTSPRLGNGTRNSIYSPRPGNRFVSFMHACGARFPILCLFKSFWVKHRYQCLATNHGSVLVYQIMLSPCSSWVGCFTFRWTWSLLTRNTELGLIFIAMAVRMFRYFCRMGTCSSLLVLSAQSSRTGVLVDDFQ